MKISIVIPNYNGKEILEKNLPKILDAAKDAEIIVVDDASTDDSIKMLADKFPHIKVIKRTNNSGFATSVNDGVKASSGDLVLLLNSDVVPENNFLKPLSKHFSDPQVFAVGSLQYSSNWKGKDRHGRGIGEFKKGFLVHGPGALNKTNTLWVFGGCGLYRKSLWEKFGGMETLYNPFYWEDIDISYRALKAGYKLVFEPESVVYHQQEQGAIRSNYTQSEIKTIAYRNQIIFVWLNIAQFSFILQHFLYLPYLLLKAIISGDYAFIKGFFAALVKLPNVLVHRWHNQKFNRISDRQLLENYLS